MDTPSQIYTFLQKQVAPFVRHYSRLQVTGLENLPLSGNGAIIACNHSGSFWWDALCLIAAFDDRPVNFVAHHWDAKIGVMKQFLERTGCGFLDEHLADINDNCSVVTGAKSGKLMCLYPEESYHSFRHRYTLFKFSPHVIKYARLAQVPIIPVTIIGAEEAAATFAGLKLKSVPLHIPFHLPLILPFKVTVDIGKPFEYHELLESANGMADDDVLQYEKAAEQLRQQMHQTMSQYRPSRLSDEKYIDRQSFF
ncbi:MAG: 1-acyl-sn-glycerol-3-phosphate acyltransferase [Hahellaceae bacterium]|nr:1-acyl-sn-glycerol-3-phosphate acyltransferase [Hahellaceae bacterium]MCP5169140.1 1-acyl-sn-glycerol-3-phosphate acyltransferase [Hahellaceae bacterium]